MHAHTIISSFTKATELQGEKITPVCVLYLQGKSRKGGSSGGPCGGGGRVQTYLHAVTAAHAARLENTSRLTY